MADKKETKIKTEMKIIQMSPKDITPYINNNKIHSDEQIDRLAGMIAEFGFDQPIVVDQAKVIIKGEGRWLAAKRLDLPTVPVHIADHLDEHQIKASRIADNKVASLEYDMEKMKFDLGSLERVGFDLNLTGLSFDELDDLMKNGEIGSDAPPNKDRPAEDYENSEIRQIVLIMDKEQFEKMLGNFSRLQKTFNCETNMGVVERLIEAFDSNPITDYKEAGDRS